MITILDNDSDMSTNNSRLCINSDNEHPDLSEVDLDLSQSTDCEVDETQQHGEVHVSYMVLLWLIMFFEAWMSINAAMIYFLKMGSCSGEYSLSFYHFSELSFAIGYGLCKLEPEYTGYVIVASMLTNFMVIVILLELIGHLLEIQLKYGEKIAVICHIVTIASFILLALFFTIMDMHISGMRTFADSLYYVFATAFTTGDRSPYGFYPSPDMTTSMGTLAEQILNIACMQLLPTVYAYCASVIACVLWSKFIKQASLTHLEVKAELMHIKTLSVRDLKSQTIQLLD